MASVNKVILVGNLTRNPEVRYIPSGAAVCDLGLAVNRKTKSADGQFKDETCFVTVTVWNRQAETSAEYLKKGSPVLIEGYLKMDEWEKDGQKFNKLGVVAQRVQFLGKASGGKRDDSDPSETKTKQVVSSESTDNVEINNNDSEDEDNLPF